MVVFRDVTRRKKSSNVVKRLINAVEVTADTVFITDRSGKIEYVNPAFEVTTGYGRTEALGKTPRILKSGHHGEEHYTKLWATILAGEVFRDTIVNRKKSGELYYADQTITPMKGTNGQISHFVAVVKDMTESRKRQEHDFELQMAAQVQSKFYPQKQPKLDGYDIAGAVFPAEATCGDYYDYIRMADGSLGIAVGDVCGHGFGPALIMAQTCAYLRTLAQVQSDPGSILNQVNRTLAVDLEKHRFVTLFLACVDTTARSLIYANAGHMPGYVLDRSGAVKASMRSSGLPLGVIPESTFSTSDRVDLESGDIVVLLTDGVTESSAQSDRFLEDEDILAAVYEHRHEPARQIVENVYQKAREFAGGAPQEDDITMVVCKVE